MIYDYVPSVGTSGKAVAYLQLHPWIDQGVCIDIGKSPHCMFNEKRMIYDYRLLVWPRA